MDRGLRDIETGLVFRVTLYTRRESKNSWDYLCQTNEAYSGTGIWYTLFHNPGAYRVLGDGGDTE